MLSRPLPNDSRGYIQLHPLCDGDKRRREVESESALNGELNTGSCESVKSKPFALAPLICPLTREIAFDRTTPLSMHQVWRDLTRRELNLPAL